MSDLPGIIRPELQALPQIADRIPDYKLNTLAGYFAVNASASHRALADCYVTYTLYEKLNEI